MSERVRIRKGDLARLRRISERRGIPMADLLALFISKMEVKKLEKEEELDECEECGAKVPKDSVFCPYCGVEFEEEEEEEEEE